MLKRLIILCLIVAPFTGRSQYIPQFSQLINTLEFVNPGYNASKIDPSATLLYRNQWTGFIGAPKTYGLNLNIPVNEWHAGFGLNTIAETRGLINQTNLSLTACVDVKVSTSAFMTFGLSGGVETKRIDMERAIYIGDLPYVAEDYNSNHIHAGLGINLFAQNLHVGLSMFLSQLDGNMYNPNEYYSVYLNGSYLVPLNDDWSLKPSAIYRHFAGFNDFDLGVFGLYKDIIWFGAAHRFGKAIIFFADFKVADFMRLAYSYDLAVGLTNSIDHGSHEITIEFTIPSKARDFERIAR
jgi:type IX secretion system PorP/SprF family membrane protein